MLKEIKKTFLLLLAAIILIFFINIVMNNSIGEMKDYALNKTSQQANYISNPPEISMKQHTISNQDKRCNDLITKSWTDKSSEAKKAKAEACAHNKNN